MMKRIFMGAFDLTQKVAVKKSRKCELLQAVAFAFFKQCLAADAENCGAASDLIVRLIQRSLDRFAFEVLKRLQRTHRVCAFLRLQNLRKILPAERQAL